MLHPNYVSRETWGAMPPDDPTRPITSLPTFVYVHHTATEQHGAEGVRDIQHYHMRVRDPRFNDIAYSWLFDDDGTIYEGRGWGVRHGANEGSDNSFSHSFCFMGNFQNRVPTEASLNSCVHMVAFGVTQGFLRNDLRGHRDEIDAQTACPGQLLYAKLLGMEKSVSTLLTTPLPSTPTPEKDDNDMAFIVQDAATGAALVVTGNAALLVTSNDDLAKHKAAGLPVVSGVSTKQFDRYKLLRIDD